MMIRAGLYSLATTTRSSPSTFGAKIARPAAVVLSGKLSGHPFSTNPKRRDDELFNKNYSDAFDESDSIEVGKEEGSSKEQATKKNKAAARRVQYSGPIFRPLWSGFDDFFARDPFFARNPFFSHEPFFARHREQQQQHPFLDDIMPVLRNSFPVDDDDGDRRMTLLRSSPGYKIKESAGTYEIAVDVPDGVGASDVKVELENDGTVLRISGGRKTNEERLVSETRFEKRFTIGDNVDTDKITANLDEGVLVLKAPKLEPETTEMPKQSIAITQEPHVSLDEEVVQKSYSDAFDESDWAETGKAEHEKDTQ